jgi:hypothetical protein
MRDFQTVNDTKGESMNTYNEIYSPIMDENSPHKDEQDIDLSRE